MLQETGHINNTILLVFRHIQCLHLMIFWVDWEQVFSRTEVLRGNIAQSRLPSRLSFRSYDYVITFVV